MEKNKELKSANKKYFDQYSDLQKKQYQLELKYEKTLLDFHNVQQEFEKTAKKLKELKFIRLKDKKEKKNTRN